MINKIKLLLKRLCWSGRSKPLEINRCGPFIKEEDCKKINETTEEYFTYTIICIILAYAAFFVPALILGDNVIHFPGIVIMCSSPIIGVFGAMWGSAWTRSREIINLLNGQAGKKK